MKRSNDFMIPRFIQKKRGIFYHITLLMLFLGAPLLALGQSASISHNSSALICGPGSVTVTANVTGNPPGSGTEPNTWVYNWYQVVNGSETAIGLNPNSRINHLGTIAASTHIRVRITDALGLLVSPLVANTTLTPGSPPAKPTVQLSNCGATVTLGGALSGETYRLVVEENEQGSWHAAATHNNSTGTFDGSALGFDPLSSIVRYKAYKVKNGTCLGGEELVTAPTFNLSNYGIIVPGNVRCGDDVNLLLDLKSTPSSAYSAYMWSISDGRSFTTTAPSLVLPQVGAATTVSVKVKDAATGCVSQGFINPATINPLQALNPHTIGDINLTNCGQNLTVSNAQAGATYRLTVETFADFPVSAWQPSGNVLSSTNGSFSNLPGLSLTTRYQLALEPMAGCLSNSLTITSFFTLPSLSLVGNACLNNTATVQVPSLPTGVTSFSWKRQKNGTTQVLSTPGTLGALSHSFLLDGDYSVWIEATDNVGCTLNSAALQVNAGQVPLAPAYSTDLPTICNGGKTLIRASGANMNESYRWYKQNSGVPTAIAGLPNNGSGGSNVIQTGSTWLLTEVLTAPTTYYVSIVGANGCEGPKTAIPIQAYSPLPQPTLVAAPLGIEKAGNKTLEVSGATGSQEYVWSTGLINPQVIQAGDAATYTANFDCTQVIYVAVKDTLSGCVGQKLAIPVRIFSNYSNLTEDSLNITAEQTMRIKVTDAHKLDTLDVMKGHTMWAKTYLDGMGRPIQSITQQSSPEGLDVVKAIVYDELGRTPLAHLPYTSAAHLTKFKPNVWDSVTSFYDTLRTQNHATTAYPYSFTALEASPLNRAVVQYAPGKHWVGALKGVTTCVQTNPDPNNANTNGLDKIRLLKANNNPTNADVLAAGQDELYLNSSDIGIASHSAQNGITLTEGFSITTDTDVTLELNPGDQNSPIVAGFYPLGELVRTTITDEDGKVTEEFKNKSGQVILKRAKVESNT
ncbi:hypothetical protein BKI52_37395 [marine bacterium AO1-C]|nr:hypothetical protein BKI52_37395 [marine bacterium AO1-C]